MKHEASLSISRVHNSGCEDYIALRIEDDDAHIQFVELEIPFKAFSEALTGLSSRPCLMVVRGLDKVGKKQEMIHPFNFELPEDAEYRDKESARTALSSACPKGWTGSDYFGSQSSFFEEDGKQFASTTLRRWVDKPDSEDQ